jgi:superfamily II DNA/RNA helicase
MLALLTFIGTEQSLWDAVLKNVKVVVSTYQILLDALTHGFVRMESLALIVFDEGDRSFTYHSSNTIQHMLTMGSPQLCFKTPRRDDNAELLP